jgi:hypothetical protein
MADILQDFPIRAALRRHLEAGEVVSYERRLDV